MNTLALVGKGLVAFGVLLAVWLAVRTFWYETAGRLKRRRTPRLPAPKPMTPYRACPELLRLREDHIRAELRLLGNELRVDPDLHLDTLDGLFTHGPHHTDH